MRIHPRRVISSTLLLSFCLGLLPFSASGNAIEANNLLLPSRIAFKPAPVPESGDYPPTRGTGSRPGQCGGESIRGQLHAMIPENNILASISPNPSISIYLPAIENQKAKFYLVNQARQSLYELSLNLSNDAGLLTIPIPENIVLEVGEIYLWGLIIECDPNNKELDESVIGGITRHDVPPPSTNQPLEQAMYYQEKGMWYEAFTLLLAMRETQPQAWADLLTAVGLEDYIDAAEINQQ